jgi:quercetin dioxygenase-like cupin family protein
MMITRPVWLLALVAAVAALPACSGAGTPAATTPRSGGTVAAPPAAAIDDASAPDPLATDPDKYTVLFENEQVRVLRYHDAPGARTQRHHHPAFVLYALAPFTRRLTLGDGSQKQRSLAAGDVTWNPAQTHVGENIGDTDTDVVIVELKTAP